MGLWRNKPTDGIWRDRLDADEAIFGPVAGHWSQYKASGAAGTLNAAEQQALTDGKNLHIYWKPQTTTWAQVASGARDSALDAAATSIGARSENIWLTIHHEPEDNVGGAGSGMTTADYRAMWAQVRARFDAAGVDNVTWCWVFQTHLNHPELLPGLWPGNSLVDVVCPQVYIVCSAAASVLATKWTDCLDWLDANRDASHAWSGADKRIAMTEWGADLGGDLGDCGVGGGNRGTAAHRGATIDGITAILSDLADRNVVEIRYFNAGSNYLTAGVDQTAFQALKDATEA